MNDYKFRKINQIKNQLNNIDLNLKIIQDDVKDLIQVYRNDDEKKEMLKYFKKIDKALHTLLVYPIIPAE